MFSLSDKRTDVIGAGFSVLPAALKDMCSYANLPEDFPLEIHLVDAVECRDHAHFGIGSEGFLIEVPVGDALEFSPKAIRRINRNLFMGLRWYAQSYALQSNFTDEIAAMLLVQSKNLLNQEAYAMAKVLIREKPNLCALQPEKVELAPDPVVKNSPVEGS